ncbi:MAG: hypothetical protein QW154_05700 [Sulfolobales archaeon]
MGSQEMGMYLHVLRIPEVWGLRDVPERPGTVKRETGEESKSEATLCGYIKRLAWVVSCGGKLYKAFEAQI